MPVELHDVLRQLDTDEPNYTVLAALGPEAVPHLLVLVRGDDPGLASKAAYLASLIQSDDSMEVLRTAATSSHESVRVAVAAGLRNVATPQALPLTDRLLDDADAGVRKQAVRAVGALGLDALEPKVRAMASRDADRALRQVARGELERIAEIRATGGEESGAPPRKSRKRAAPRRRKAAKK